MSLEKQPSETGYTATTHQHYNIGIFCCYAGFLVVWYLMLSKWLYLPHMLFPGEKYIYAPRITPLIEAHGAAATIIVLLVPYCIALYMAQILFHNLNREHLVRRIAFPATLAVFPCGLLAGYIQFSTQVLYDWAGLGVLYFLAIYIIVSLIILPIVFSRIMRFVILFADTHRFFSRMLVVIPIIFLAIFGVRLHFATTAYLQDLQNCGLNGLHTLGDNSECIKTMILTTGDVALCEKVHSRSPEFCYVDIAEVTKDPKICTRITNPASKGKCLGFLMGMGAEVNDLIESHEDFVYLLDDFPTAIKQPEKVFRMNLM